MPKKKEELAESKGTDLVAAVAEENMEMFMEDGQEDDGINQKDCAIPRLTLLQNNSPQCSKGNAKHIAGAEAGDFYDSVNQKVFKGEEGVKVIPCSHRSTFLEWHDRDSKEGSGFVADHGDNPEILYGTTKNEKDKYVTEAGTIIEKTAEYYVLLIDEGGFANPYVLSLKSSGLTVSRNWNSKIKLARRKNAKNELFKPAPYYLSFTVTSKPQSGTKGGNDYTWMNWEIESSDDVPTLDGGIGFYTEAKALVKAVNSGDKKADNENAEAF